MACDDMGYSVLTCYTQEMENVARFSVGRHCSPAPTHIAWIAIQLTEFMIMACVIIYVEYYINMANIYIQF